MTDDDDAASAAALALLARRAPGATICPSEVARALAAAAGVPGQWRDRMAAVHAAADALAAAGSVRLSWQGRALPARAGPYRIGRIGTAAAPRAAGRGSGADPDGR